MQDNQFKKNWIGQVEINKTLANTGEFFALKLKEDSMSPILIEDDILVIKKQNDFETGDIIVAMVENKQLLIRKARKNNGSILLQAFNPIYEPLLFTKDKEGKTQLKIVGIVKQLKRQF